MEKSFKEKRVRNITQIYYSRKDVQKAIYDFCQNREISPRYFEGFGKRPDTFQYINDIFELVKKGATSFHCSEEIWSDPLQISTDMSSEQYNEIRDGWDLILDIDCKWFDYSKLAVQAIIKVLNNHGVKNIGIKFSGSKGWHIIVPNKAFPKEIGGIKTKDSFPEIPRQIINYIRFKSEKELKKILPEDFSEQFKEVKIKRGIKCNKCSEITDEYKLADFFCERCGIGEQRKLLLDDKKEYKCPDCKAIFMLKSSIPFYECSKCRIDSKKNSSNFSRTIEEDLFDVMGLDLVLISPRHLFRAPYSLHEKTALASVVLSPEEISTFELKDASPMEVKIRNFMPDVKENEASKLMVDSLEWCAENKPNENKKTDGKYANFKQIVLKNITEKQFPPCIINILNGVKDGKKRALFSLIHFFRSIGLDKIELEKKIEVWNKKNTPSLKQGYITSQLSWAYGRKPLMPSNCKEFYQGIGVCVPDNLCKSIKNPVNYIVRKNFRDNNKDYNKKKIEKKKPKKKKKENPIKEKIKKENSIEVKKL